MHIAHINPKTKEEQSVEEHCKSVSEFCEIFGAKVGLKNTAGLAGETHDFGKDTNRFETYLRYCSDHPDDHSQRGKINHSAAGGKFIYDNFYDGGDIYQKLTAQILALAICSHHSGLPDIIDLNGIDDFDKKIHPQEDISYEEAFNNFTNHIIEVPQINKQFYKSRDEIIEIINRLKEAKISDNFTMHLLVKYLFSCLIDADRLDTFNFMEDKQEDLFQDTIDLWVELSDRLEEAISKFSKKTKMDLLRGEISDECKDFAHHKPGVYKLCVPTGGGKTLSSLRYALEHAKIAEFKKERIFYIIPFTTIIDQNAQVIKDILKRDDVILEHHSNLVIDNEQEDHKLLTERWSSPIILTTMVQFLNTLYSGGTQDVRRMHNLANSVIIFDEIQSVPIKCVHMLNAALNFLSQICNATIILCTATQPLLSETARPLKLNIPVDIIENVGGKFRQFKRVNLVPSLINGGYEINELADFVLDKMDNVKNALVIMNTKNSAKSLYNQLKEQNKILPVSKRFSLFHLSTSMCPKHRLEILDKLKVSLINDRVILISTQLIEAGVDISFECVVRTIAGLDSIAQAAGRCNRHGEKPCADVYIVNIRGESLSMLPDIQEGRSCAMRVLDEFKDNPEIFDDDLLSPKAIERYYEYYFYARKEKMDYNIQNKNETLYDLLSINDKGTKAYMERSGKKPQYPINQAFKTAGEHFCVIENNTIGVIVPYGEGKNLIANINGNCSLGQLKEYIREAQRYSVNLFENDTKKIGNGIYPLMNGGILALREEFYHDNVGVITEEKPMELLSK